MSISGVYDELSDYRLAGVDEVDPVSMAYEIWRIASERHPGIAETAAALPNVVYSTKQAVTATQCPGVLVHTQTGTGADAFAFVGPAGQARRVTPQDALRMAECEPSTPSVPRWPNHHALTAAALGGPLRTPAGRATGALQGVRGKVWRMLHERMDTFTDNLLFTKADLADAHDAMNEHPLRESATHLLAKATRDRSTDDLAALVVALHNDGQLCIPVTTPSNPDNEPAIVCTVGLREN